MKSAYTETLSSDEKNVSIFESNCETDQSWIKSATEEQYLIWGYNDYRLDGLDSNCGVVYANPADVGDIIIMLILNGAGLLTFISLTTHVWTSKAWTYPLERDVFVLPGFRIIYTGLYNLLNRRVVDLEEELGELYEKYGKSRSYSA